MKLIVINNIEVQNANTVSGLTYGSISLTSILGFTDLLNRKLQRSHKFSDIQLKGCAIVIHDYHLHIFRADNNALKFTQSRNSPYLHGLSDDKKSASASIIEEGKINVKLSLIIAYEGNIYDEEIFTDWLFKQCYLQRISGGTILDIKKIHLFSFENNDKNKPQLKALVRSLLPGFILYDSSESLIQYMSDNKIDQLPAWIDFFSLKQIARPAYHLINAHLENKAKRDETDILLKIWQDYLENSYQHTAIPLEITSYFANLEKNKKNKELLLQWQNYVEPTHKTNAEWQYIPKPTKGYLVPIMCGYKAISSVYPNDEVENTRDAHTEVCFVESVHSIGEWRSVHRMKELEDLQNALWCYDYEPNWYLCKQNYQISTTTDLQVNPY